MATRSIEQILGITERVLDVPIRAVVGGLHLPVHAAAEGQQLADHGWLPEGRA